MANTKNMKSWRKKLVSRFKSFSHDCILLMVEVDEAEDEETSHLRRRTNDQVKDFSVVHVCVKERREKDLGFTVVKQAP